MPTGDVMKATLEGTFDSEPVVIGLGFISNSGIGVWTDDAQQLGTELAAALGIDAPGGAFLTPLSVQYKLHMIRIQDLNPGLASSHEWFVNQEGGNVVDDAMPPNDALCVTWRTGLKGKQNRGRSYLTGFAEDSHNGGYWIGEIQAWAQGSFAMPLLAAFGPAGTGNYSLALVHTQLGGARLIPPTATPIVEYAIRNEVRTLRRRAVGVRISRRRTGP